MSLLSDTNHSPQRVYALLRLLDALGGELTFEEIKTWFKPARRGLDVPADEGSDVNLRQMIGAAASLGLVTREGQNRYRLQAAVPETAQAFADQVHDMLAALPDDHADYVLFEAFAAMVALTESQSGTAWLSVSAKDRASRINDVIRRELDGDDDEKMRFNNTKASPWKRWMIFLGLGTSLAREDLYPYPANRLEREIARARHEGILADSMDMEAFMAFVAKRMPYLDGGSLFEFAVQALTLPPRGRTVSRVLSGTLRDLHDDGRIVLKTIGDAKASFALTREPHPVGNVMAVDLVQGNPA